jgi:hypothetical protein
LVKGLVLLGTLFEQTDRAAEAYRRLSMALRHDPDSLEIRAAIARNRHAAGRWRDTLAAIEPIEQRLDAGLELSRAARPSWSATSSCSPPSATSSSSRPTS